MKCGISITQGGKFFAKEHPDPKPNPDPDPNPNPDPSPNPNPNPNPNPGPGPTQVLDGVTVLLPTVYDPSELRSDITGKLVRYLVEDGAQVEAAP